MESTNLQVISDFGGSRNHAGTVGTEPLSFGNFGSLYRGNQSPDRSLPRC